MAEVERSISLIRRVLASRGEGVRRRLANPANGLHDSRRVKEPDAPKMPNGRFALKCGLAAHCLGYS